MEYKGSAARALDEAHVPGHFPQERDLQGVAVEAVRAEVTGDPSEAPGARQAAHFGLSREELHPGAPAREEERRRETGDPCPHDAEATHGGPFTLR